MIFFWEGGYLSAPVTLEEIKAAVFSIDDCNSPGPDEFLAKFYKLHWDALQNDIFKSTSDIFHTKNCQKG